MFNVQPVTCTGGRSRVPAVVHGSRPSGHGFETVAETLLGGVVRIFETLWLWFERRRQRNQLMALDDRMLADIGISRAEAAREFDKSFWRA